MSELQIPASLAPLFGSPEESMDAAKSIIGNRISADHALLGQIGAAKDVQKWPRIAAIYALGFVGERESAPVIRRILADETNDPAIRAHAAEALGNLRDRDSVGLLRDVLAHRPPSDVAESCSYALHELGAFD
jgi:HEAT repeat protein